MRYESRGSRGGGRREVGQRAERHEDGRAARYYDRRRAPPPHASAKETPPGALAAGSSVDGSILDLFHWPRPSCIWPRLDGARPTSKDARGHFPHFSVFVWGQWARWGGCGRGEVARCRQRCAWLGHGLCVE